MPPFPPFLPLSNAYPQTILDPGFSFLVAFIECVDARCQVPNGQSRGSSRVWSKAKATTTEQPARQLCIKYVNRKILSGLGFMLYVDIRKLCVEGELVVNLVPESQELLQLLFRQAHHALMMKLPMHTSCIVIALL